MLRGSARKVEPARQARPGRGEGPAPPPGTRRAALLILLALGLALPAAGQKDSAATPPLALAWNAAGLSTCPGPGSTPRPRGLLVRGGDEAPERIRFLAGLPLRINRASAAELELLPGVGPALARRIVERRQDHGPFRGAADLLAVRGIGPARLSRLAPLVSLDPR